MKKMRLKPWQLYVLVFILMFGINYLLRWISAGEEIKDGNLVVSLVFPVMLTLGFIAGDRVRRRNKKYKDKVEELLKNNE
ncbi:hypothetical protein [Mediterranea massiliensis]|uniref:hypothetical protein n=1 Tax=Mediterranea massiliensis TaxID=1841865 RepID=UPI0025A3611C|nr:hypothetical protein [Mediterranea massiliensis]MDM8338862.1 hypothetical protein [Mediterranea massiliensis]